MDGKKLCLGCMEFYDTDLDVCPYCGYAEGTQSSHVLHLTPGTVLHRRYIVGKSLGYGSFGVTYIGWDKLMKRKVAIKEYLPSEYATRMLKTSEIIVPSAESSQNKYDKGMKKFRQEAEKLAKVGNIDGVVYVYDTFEENNTAYIVMEYLHGQTLAAYMQEKGILSEEETLDLMLPVLQALESIHEKHIIHRDISPDNIFISVDSAGNRKVKLIDFGAAKFASSSHSKSLTVLLRPGYSPEEQYRSGGEQGPYTDVYAVAAVMYQMVTGVRPPDALERRTSIERKKKDLIAEPGTLNRELSDNFETALMNALNVKIEDRTATADDFIAELISFEKVKRRGNSIKQIDFFRWPLWAKILVPVSGLAAVALLIGAGIWLNSLFSAKEFVMPENCTRVVNFTGATSREAEELAQDAGLVMGISDTEFSPAMTGNRVLQQDQAAGSIVPVNTLVNMVLSTDLMSFAMPDVTGMSIQDARYALECMGMEIQIQEGTLNGLTACGIVSQDIEPYSEVIFGQTVVLTVTPEDENPAGNVPQLAGLSYGEALSAAEAAGVRMVVKQRVFSRDCSEATVLEQGADAGSELKSGEAVAVTVAVPWREFAMPNLLYKDRETAVQILKNIGINPEIEEQVSEVVTKDMVFGQSVMKDAAVEPDALVVLTVSSGTTPFEMPSIEGLAAEEAEKTLTEYKLVPLEEKGYDENVAEGSVISQNIASGTSVTRGTEVTYVVCSHEGLQKVPDVRNQNVEQAKSALESAGFAVQVDTNGGYNPTVPKDAVLSQFPNGGTMQAEGSTVTITLSKGPEPVPETTAPPATQGPASFTWSDWGPSAPAGSETRSKTQYRYRVRETTTSGSPTLDGWSLYNTSGAWSDWSGWSDWTTSPISASDSVSVETITQYRYRDMEYTSSTSASLDGWTQIGSSESYTDYGGWSEWNDAAVSASDTRQVETATIWGYYYFQCPGCGNHWHGWDFKCASWGGGGCGTYVPESGWHRMWSTTNWDSAGLYEFHGTGKYATDSLPGGRWFRWEYGGVTGYRYRDRSKVTTYSYQKWGDWSGWGDTPVSASSERQVETRTLYRSRTRSVIYTYHFERWGNWSAYSDTPAYANSDTEVQTRTLYSYKIYQ